MAKPIKIEILGDARGFRQAADEVAGGVERLGRLATVGFAAAGAAAAGAAVGLFKIGESFDAASDRIRVVTGQTGDALAGLQNDFDQVVKTVPASFDDAGEAIAGLNRRLGLTGEPLQNLAGQFLNLSRITGTDVAGNVDLVTRVFGDWQIAAGDQAGTLDKMFRATQASGIGFDDLAQSVVQFSAPLRNLGFSFDQSQALLALWSKTGVNTETVVAGLKKGVGTLAKAGEDVPATFRRVVGEIQRLGPGTEATTKAMELFGSKAGGDMVDAITGGKFAIDDMLTAITGGKDTINTAAADTADFAEKWAVLKNRVFVGLKPVALALFDAIGTAMDRIAPIADRTVIAFTGIVRFFQDNKNILIGAISGVTVVLGVWTVSTIAANAANIALAFSTALAALPVIALGVAIGALVALLINAYQHNQRFRDIVDSIGRVLQDKVLPAVKAVAGWIAGTLIPTVATVATKFIEIEIAIVKLVAKVLSYGDDIYTAITAPFNRAFDWINRQWTKISGIFDKARSLTGLLPGFATGGQQVATGGGWATVGERGRETVYLPQGSRVVPAWAGNNKTGGDTYNIYGPNLTAPEMARELAWARRRGDGR